MDAGAFQTEENAQIERSPAGIGGVTVGTAIVARDILDEILQGTLVTSLLSSVDCSRHLGRLHKGRCDTKVLILIALLWCTLADELVGLSDRRSSEVR